MTPYCLWPKFVRPTTEPAGHSELARAGRLKSEDGFYEQYGSRSLLARLADRLAPSTEPIQRPHPALPRRKAPECGRA